MNEERIICPKCGDELQVVIQLTGAPTQFRHSDGRVCIEAF